MGNSGSVQPSFFPGPGAGFAAGDFNGDGKVDLAITGSAGVSIYLGNGDGTFRPTGSYGPGGQSIAVADFNQDGKLDLVDDGNSEAYILLGNGDGTFRPGIPYLLADSSNFLNAVSVGNFNKDAVPDLVGAGSNGGNLSGVISILLSAPFKAIFQGSLNFGSQGVGTTSPHYS
jgi:hypothetical protein